MALPERDGRGKHQKRSESTGDSPALFSALAAPLLLFIIIVILCKDIAKDVSDNIQTSELLKEISCETHSQGTLL